MWVGEGRIEAGRSEPCGGVLSDAPSDSERAAATAVAKARRSERAIARSEEEREKKRRKRDGREGKYLPLIHIFHHLLCLTNNVGYSFINRFKLTISYDACHLQQPVTLGEVKTGHFTIYPY